MAGRYLVCDAPDPAEKVGYYTLAGLPGDPRVDIDPSGEHGFKYDLSQLPAGEYSLRVSACNEWTCSLPAPFTFTALGAPAQPTGLRILQSL